MPRRINDGAGRCTVLVQCVSHESRSFSWRWPKGLRHTSAGKRCALGRRPTPAQRVRRRVLDRFHVHDLERSCNYLFLPISFFPATGSIRRWSVARALLPVSFFFLSVFCCRQSACKAPTILARCQLLSLSRATVCSEVAIQGDVGHRCARVRRRWKKTQKQKGQQSVCVPTATTVKGHILPRRSRSENSTQSQFNIFRSGSLGRLGRGLMGRVGADPRAHTPPEPIASPFLGPLFFPLPRNGPERREKKEHNRGRTRALIGSSPAMKKKAALFLL